MTHLARSSTMTSTMTSKGQVTIPADIRAKLRLKPGQRVQFVSLGDAVAIQADTWQQDLTLIQKKAKAAMQKSRLPALSDADLGKAIDEAGSAAANQRYQRNDKR